MTHSERPVSLQSRTHREQRKAGSLNLGGTLYDKRRSPNGVGCPTLEVKDFLTHWDLFWMFSGMLPIAQACPGCTGASTRQDSMTHDCHQIPAWPAAARWRPELWALPSPAIVPVTPSLPRKSPGCRENIHSTPGLGYQH